MSEPRSLTVSVPLPPDVLWPNQAPGHWGEKTEQRAAYRLVCAKKVGAAWGSQPCMRRAAIGLLVVFCRQRRRDPDNCLAALKAAIDGIVDAGVIPTDSPKHVALTRVAVERHRHRAGERCAGSEVFVTVEEMGP